jgi:tetratricopeptide (TPR) repeat protein
LFTSEVRKAISDALRKGLLEDARAMLEQERARSPDAEELAYFQGVLFLAQGKIEEGIAKLKDALSKAEERSNFVLAIAAAARVAEADPRDIDTRLRRADLYTAMGLEHAAYDYLLREFDFYRKRNDPRLLSFIVKKIIMIDEANLDLALKMAKILALLGQKNEVHRVVENVIFTLQGQGKYDEAANIQKEYTKLYEEL